MKEIFKRAYRLHRKQYRLVSEQWVFDENKDFLLSLTEEEREAHKLAGFAALESLTNRDDAEWVRSWIPQAKSQGLRYMNLQAKFY